MTSREIEDKRFEYFNYIADKFKDLESQVQALKNPEDDNKVKQVTLKIKDICDDINRTYGDIDDLDREVPDDEGGYY